MFRLFHLVNHEWIEKNPPKPTHVELPKSPYRIKDKIKYNFDTNVETGDIVKIELHYDDSFSSENFSFYMTVSHIGHNRWINSKSIIGLV